MADSSSWFINQKINLGFSRKHSRMFAPVRMSNIMWKCFHSETVKCRYSQTKTIGDGLFSNSCGSSLINYFRFGISISGENSCSHNFFLLSLYFWIKSHRQQPSTPQQSRSIKVCGILGFGIPSQLKISTMVFFPRLLIQKMWNLSSSFTNLRSCSLELNPPAIIQLMARALNPCVQCFFIFVSGFWLRRI